MKRFVSLALVLVFLCGCSADSEDMDRVLGLRSQIDNSSSCTFIMSVTADYGETTSSFKLSCVFDSTQNLKITVVEPASIAGITCDISGGSGKLVFEDKLLAFEMLADGLISPVSAPWFFMKALHSGYISACSKNDQYTTVRIDDSYGQTPYSMEIWLDDGLKPVSAEIIWEGKRILSMNIYDFVIL